MQQPPVAAVIFFLTTDDMGLCAEFTVAQTLADKLHLKLCTTPAILPKRGLSLFQAVPVQVEP
ncbi:MAG: hypothetical protein IJ496_06490 [Ruminococcus sp.]|nr:hypothetical protein [Ruminococcus sp.]